MSHRYGESHHHDYVADAGRYEWFKETRKQVEVRCTPEAVEQFKHAHRRTHYYKVCDGVRYRMTPEEIERLKTALRHRKETEMPNYATWPRPAKTPKITDFFKEVLKENPTISAHLMTPEQVKARLRAGEDPLLLSIEHWVQNAAYIKEHGSLPRQSYRSKTCALCVVYTPDHGEEGCKKCPLGISQGTTCGGFSLTAVGPWAKFNLDPSYDNAMNMVAVLASLKPPVPQFYIDGEGEGKVALRLAQRPDGRIVLEALTVSSIGHELWWCLLDIDQGGSVRQPVHISPNTGLDLDDAGGLRLQRET